VKGGRWSLRIQKKEQRERKTKHSGEKNCFAGAPTVHRENESTGMRHAEFQVPLREEEGYRTRLSSQFHAAPKNCPKDKQAGAGRGGDRLDLKEETQGETLPPKNIGKKNNNGYYRIW